MEGRFAKYGNNGTTSWPRSNHNLPCAPALTATYRENDSLNDSEIESLDGGVIAQVLTKILTWSMKEKLSGMILLRRTKTIAVYCHVATKIDPSHHGETNADAN